MLHLGPYDSERKGAGRSPRKHGRMLLVGALALSFLLAKAIAL